MLKDNIETNILNLKEKKNIQANPLNQQSES
jgi:hypothetical protein